MGNCRTVGKPSKGFLDQFKGEGHGQNCFYICFCQQQWHASDLDENFRFSLS
jgi:hypothetical protein